MDDFVRQIDRMAREYPGDAEEALEKGAKHMLQAIKKASPVGKAAYALAESLLLLFQNSL